MSIERKMRLAGKSLLARLTGLSCAFVGAEWVPPIDERDKARRLLVFLSDRRALFAPFEYETEIFVKNSILDIRKRVMEDLETVGHNSQLGQSLLALGAACRKFLTESEINFPDEAPHYPRHRFGENPKFFRSLGEFRIFMGIHIAVLAFTYNLAVEGELTTILPPDPGDKKSHGKQKKAS